MGLDDLVMLFKENALLEHDELKASFIEIVKKKNKMSDLMAVVSDGNPTTIWEKKQLS